MNQLDQLMIRLWCTIIQRPRSRGRECGDVPGWVMITILSAVLVVGLIAIAGPQLNDLFTNATNGVAKKSP